jgi:Domain of unknown function (DUF5666)
MVDGSERPDMDPVEVIELDRPAVDSGTSFRGTTGRRSALVRVGALVGAVGALVLSAALTMAASPAPSAGAPAASTAPGAATPGGNGPWAGARGMMGGGPGQGWARGGARGVGQFGAISIAAIDGSNLSLKTADGWTRTITVGTSTTITKGGQTIVLGELKVGDQIVFRQTRNADGTYTITAIQVVLPSASGTVGAITSNGFTVKAGDGTTTKVVVTGSTTYHLGRAAGTKADVKVGDRVAVQGTRASDGTMTATTVQVAPAMVAGDVTAKTSDSITVRLAGGTTTTIHVSSATTYRVAGKSSATLADIAVGSRIIAQGTQNTDGSLQATDVASMPAAGAWGPGGVPGFGRHGSMTTPGGSAGPSLQG